MFSSESSMRFLFKFPEIFPSGMPFKCAPNWILALKIVLHSNGNKNRLPPVAPLWIKLWHNVVVTDRSKWKRTLCQRDSEGGYGGRGINRDNQFRFVKSQNFAGAHLKFIPDMHFEHVATCHRQNRFFQKKNDLAIFVTFLKNSRFGFYLRHAATH